MARGQPDYGMYASKDVSASISDMGEVAARLGSIVTYDKRGDVVDFDNFEGPVLSWQTCTFVAGDYVKLDSTSVKSGCQAVKLHCEDADIAFGRLEKGIALLSSRRLGIEISFSNLTTAPYFDFRMFRETGTLQQRAWLRINFEDRQIALYDKDGNWLDVLATGHFRIVPHTYHTVKLVADFTAETYSRLLFNERELDISSHALFSQASVAAPYVELFIQTSARDSLGGDIWIDDFILTQAEP